MSATVLGIARDVAVRLKDRDRVDAAITAAKTQTAFPKSIHWQPFGVGQGYAGLALMYGYLDGCFPGEGWDRVGHRYLTVAASGAEVQVHLPTGLFSGLSGLGLAAWSLSRADTRYQTMLARIDEVLLPQAVLLAERLSRQHAGVSVGHYDLISGLAGVGAYLLCRRRTAAAADALHHVVRSLIALTAETDGTPAWSTPPHLIGDETLLQQHPNGLLNCGLAHGIPGPLALLALAHLHEVKAEGLAEAIDRTAAWLARHRIDDHWGINWPTAVPLPAPPSAPACDPPPIGPSRAAWCYGSPGVARALWLAGAALQRPAYRELAVTALEAVYQRPLAERRIDSATFCHGIAGLLQITLCFAQETDRPVFAQAAAALTDQILALYDPTSRFGFYNLEPGGGHIDQPGLLDGVPGVILALLAAATPVEPGWDRLFLLS